MKDALLPHVRLRFHIDHPNYEECYLSGYECAALEISEEDNPFRKGSQEAQQWQEGWWAGFYCETPLFSRSTSEQGEQRGVIPIDKILAANDQQYAQKHGYLFLFFEISSVIVASAAVGYHLLEIVA